MGDTGRTERKRTLIPAEEPGHITERPPAQQPVPPEPVKVPEREKVPA